MACRVECGSVDSGNIGDMTEQFKGTEYMSIQDAATALGASTKFIRDLITAGHLPASRVVGTRMIRIHRSDFDALMKPIGELP